MRHWSQLAARNWRVRPGRAAATVVAIALGVGVVVWVTSSYESVRVTLSERVVDRWVGRSHISVESPLGHWGHISEDILEVVAGFDEVIAVAPRLKRRMNIIVDPSRGIAANGGNRVIEIDAIGIDPTVEFTFRPLDVAGRLILPDDRNAALVEGKIARSLGLALGDIFTIEAYDFGPSREFKIIGTYEARRVAKFQRPIVYTRLDELQSINNEHGKLTSVDAMCLDPDPQKIDELAEKLRAEFAVTNAPCQVTTSSARLTQLAEAQRQTEFALMLVSSVALLTAFFIIMTTMSVGMSERIRRLGMLRCVGMTRTQVFVMVLGESLPLGFVGMILGIPVGLLLAYASTIIAADYFQDVVLSSRGTIFALIGGAATTFGSALAPAIQAARTSPLAASRPQAKPARTFWPFIAALCGTIMVLAQTWMVDHLPAELCIQPGLAISGTALLNIGYGLMMPLAVQLAGRVLVPIVAVCLGVRARLMNDQVGKAAWRGAGICCGLMVGLSLMVSVVVHAAGVRAGWDFPKRIAEAFVWSRTPMPGWYTQFVRGMPGVAECTFVNEVLCDVGEEKKGFFDILKLRSTFVAGEAERFLDMTQLVFHEGNYDDAYDKCRRGGYILVPHEASRAFNLHLGDHVPITVGARSAVFEVAGVVQSPALDIAVNYFQADSYMMLAASGSILGTLADVREHFGIDKVTLILFNIDQPTGDTPEWFRREQPPAATIASTVAFIVDTGLPACSDPEEFDILLPRLKTWLEDTSQPFPDPFLIEHYRDALGYVANRWDDLEPHDRWELYFDQLVMRQVARAVDRPNAIFGSLRELKQHIDRDIRQATLLLAAIPIVALIVAAIGIGNLMTANVISRSRELAILRSTGATRSQIVRLVLGEALVLGLVGSAAGIALGLHGAMSVNKLTTRLIGFEPQFSFPWVDVSLGVALTVGVCMLAGISPSLRAARSDILSALRNL